MTQAPGEETSQSCAEEDLETGAPPAKKTALGELFGDFFSTAHPTGSDEDAPTPWHQVVEEEIQLYKMAPVIAIDSNPLDWWKAHEQSYPHLAKLAKRYLAVQATSVASERVFSTAGDVVTAQRNALDPDNVNMLIFLKKNLKIPK